MASRTVVAVLACVWLGGCRAQEPTSGPTIAAGPASAKNWCMEIPPQTHERFQSIWGAARNQIWTLARNEVVFWNGARWADQYFDDERIFTRLRGSGPGDIWAAGRDEGAPALLRWDGTRWWEDFCARFTGTMTDAWADGRGEVWAVAEGYPAGLAKNGALFRRESRDWRLVSVVEAPLRSVWGSSAADVWVVGERGAIHHWNGKALKASPSPTQATLKRLWGTGPSDIWAVGDRGTVVRWNGSNWSVLPLPAGAGDALEDVSGTDSKDVWIVGEGGVVLRWNGVALSKVAVDPGPFPPCGGAGSAMEAQLDFKGVFVADGLPRLVTADGRLIRRRN
jgi:hypothetical protein